MKLPNNERYLDTDEENYLLEFHNENRAYNFKLNNEFSYKETESKKTHFNWLNYNNTFEKRMTCPVRQLF